jgi:hypothetical protein
MFPTSASLPSQLIKPLPIQNSDSYPSFMLSLGAFRKPGVAISCLLLALGPVPPLIAEAASPQAATQTLRYHSATIRAGPRPPLTTAPGPSRSTPRTLRCRPWRQFYLGVVPPAADLPGFLIESVYKPVRHAGGDFFYIRPVEQGGLLVVVGDVSGKGLRAAMTVNLVIKLELQTCGRSRLIWSTLLCPQQWTIREWTADS